MEPPWRAAEFQFRETTVGSATARDADSAPQHDVQEDPLVHPALWRDQPRHLIEGRLDEEGVNFGGDGRPTRPSSCRLWSRMNCLPHSKARYGAVPASSHTPNRWMGNMLGRYFLEGGAKGFPPNVARTWPHDYSVIPANDELAEFIAARPNHRHGTDCS